MRDWHMKFLCTACSAVMAAELDGAYELRKDQFDNPPMNVPCDRCGKKKPCSTYWITKPEQT